MNVFEVVQDNCRSQQYLTESWQSLTEGQRIALRECERELWPLMESLVVLFEQRLRAEDIEKLFTAAEEQSTGKLTKAGRAGQAAAGAAKLGADTIKQINQKVNELGKKLQDTEPVKNFDAQIEKLKQDIKQKAGDDNKIVKQVEKYGDWAKENPGKSAFVIGVLTAAAAFAGGPAGGAAVGFLLRSANEMVKGEKASTAVGKATKTAAIGAIAGAVADAIGGNIDIAEPASEGDPAAVSAQAGSDEIASAANAEPEQVASSLAEMTEEQFRMQYAEQLAERFGIESDAMIQKMAENITISGNYPSDFSANFEGNVIRNSIYLTPEEAEAYQQWSEGKSISQKMGPEGTEWLSQNVEGVNQSSAADAASEPAADQGANDQETATQAGSISAQEFADLKQAGNLTADDITNFYSQNPEELVKAAEEAWDGGGASIGMKVEQFLYSEYGDQVRDLQGSARNRFIDSLSRAAQTAESVNISGANSITEAPAALAAAGDKIKQAAGNVKKQATQAVTKQKLMRAWKKEGQPLDYGSIVKIMQNAGLSTQEIESVAQSAKVELPTRSQAKGVKPGQTVQGTDGDSYEWKGAQLVNKTTGKVAKKDIAQKLTKQAKTGNQSTADRKLQKLAQAIKQAGAEEQVRRFLEN